MRALIAAALLWATAARAEPPTDHTNWFAGPIAPHFFAYDLDDRGLPSRPFDPRNDFKSGVAANLALAGAQQFTEGSRTATHLTADLRLQNRLGGSFVWSRYDSGAFDLGRRGDRLAIYGTADLSRTPGRFVEYGFGATTLQSSRSLWGPSFEVKAEQAFRAPWSVRSRYAFALVSGGMVFHELSGAVGANWRRLGVDAGYRAMLNGLRNVYGPEVALRFWL